MSPPWTRPSTWAPALLGLAFLPALAQGQAPKDDDPDKVSNDQPSRPIQMPAASPEVKEAFDDFDRFNRRGAWERATKALYSIPEAQATRFVDGPDGFILPVAWKRRSVLAGLAPEGLAAYRLFYDADAKKMLDGAEGPTEQATLEKLFSAYFLTTVGDNAADRLGDLYFEQGRFDRAADCWLAVFRERPDSDLAPAQLGLKAALALKRAGRGAEAEAIRAELLDRFATEVITLAGRKAKVAEQVRAVLGEPPGKKAESAAVEVKLAPLPEPVGPAWQVRFGDSVIAGMTPLERTQWDENSLSMAVPRVAVAGPNLYANYFGHVFAVELATGKLLWRSASFHNVDVAANGDQARMIDPGRYAVLAGMGLVWDLSRDLRDQNYMATAQLTCRRAENGEVAWQTANKPDFAGVDLVGLPILADDTLLVAGKATGGMNGQDGLARQVVMAIRPRDGKLLWKTDVGTFRQAQQMYYYAMRDDAPQPRLTYHAGSAYLDTHQGVLVRLDVKSGRVDWGYAYRTEAVQGQSRFFFVRMQQMQETTAQGAAPLPTAEGLVIKGAKSDRICAIDPDRLKVTWERPIAQSSRLLGVDDDAVYLGGPDLNAFDRKTKALKWSLPLPGGSEDGQVLLRADGLWQLTPRGIFEVDPKTGRVRRIFRNEDGGVAGGDLILTDRDLFVVSNRAISAYPRGGTRGEPTAGKDASTTKTGGSDE